MSAPDVNPARLTEPRTTGEFRVDAQARMRGLAYLRYREQSELRIVLLDPAAAPVYVGRHEGCAAQVTADTRVSRRHARLVFGAGSWSLEDAGSRNGTALRGRPLSGECILSPGDIITVGDTPLAFCAPGSGLDATTPSGTESTLLTPTPTQRRVLIELARPWFEPVTDVPVVPTNAEIAARLGYETSTIRDAISALYRQAGLARGEVSQREALVRLAITEGVVRPHDLG